MKLGNLISSLIRIRDNQGEDIEVRIGEYGNRTSVIDGQYYDIDENIVVIH